MIHSMTGFGKAEGTVNNKKITIEVKSLNSKTADIKLRFPSAYREKELVIRNLISKQLERGKIDLNIHVEDHDSTPNTTINEDKFLAYYNQLKTLSAKVDARPELFNTALRMPEVIESMEEGLNKEEWLVTETVILDAISKLQEFRLAEGTRLNDDFTDRLNAISKQLERIEKLAPERAESVKARMEQKLSDLGALDENDRGRMQQEIVYYLEKYDLNEEIVRLKSHLLYFNETVTEKVAQGKKLGFISQEMGREINTIGSKANHAEIQKLVVVMKDELEKIKEQALNVL